MITEIVAFVKHLTVNSHLQSFHHPRRSAAGLVKKLQDLTGSIISTGNPVTSQLFILGCDMKVTAIYCLLS